VSYTQNDLSTESSEHYETLIEEVEQMIHLFGFEGRTPLNVIVGYADFLLSGQLGTLSDEQQKAIENIRATVRRLLIGLRCLWLEVRKKNKVGFLVLFWPRLQWMIK
jgi:hypothetical protein